MLPALLDEERRTLRLLAFAVCGATIAILPFAMPSSFSAGAATLHAERTAQAPSDLGALSFPAIALGRDPFVPDSAFATAAASAEQRGDAGAAVLRAVVSGAQSHALVELAGVVRVVSIGDTLGTATVTAIDANELLLSNGMRLPLATERP